MDQIVQEYGVHYGWMTVVSLNKHDAKNEMGGKMA